MSTAVSEGTLTSSPPKPLLPADPAAGNVVLPGSGDSRGEILVVDDEPTLLRGISRLLTDRGYNVVCARDGESALGTFQSREFDVIVTDIAMPEMDGIQLLQQLRKHDAEVPVVLITGEPAVSTAVKALEFGAFHYLTKPVPFSDLEEVVDKAACLRRMARMKR
jgi:DNA-binding NtrC family response regulator